MARVQPGHITVHMQSLLFILNPLEGFEQECDIGLNIKKITETVIIEVVQKSTRDHVYLVGQASSNQWTGLGKIEKVRGTSLG